MRPLLLLDLDGVVVLEVAPPHVACLEIIRLHELLDDVLRRLGLPVVVLTHRSRREAARILQSAGLTSKDLAGVIAAEDIFLAALKSRRPWSLLTQGLKKSWALAEIERRYGVARQQIAFIDDHLENLEDLLGHGIGLALHAPSGIADDGSSLVGFDFDSVAEILLAWGGKEPVPEIVEVPPRTIDIGKWARTGHDTLRQSQNNFNRLRRHGRAIRSLLQHRMGQPLAGRLHALGQGR